MSLNGFTTLKKSKGDMRATGRATQRASRPWHFQAGWETHWFLLYYHSLNYSYTFYSLLCVCFTIKVLLKIKYKGYSFLIWAPHILLTFYELFIHRFRKKAYEVLVRHSVAVLQHWWEGTAVGLAVRIHCPGPGSLRDTRVTDGMPGLDTV